MLRRVIVMVTAVVLMLFSGPAVGMAAPPPTDPPAVTDNEFVPADRDLSECVSAVPRPDCGSSAKGGWRQAVVFGIVVVALVLIGWRITRAVRRNRKILETNGR